MLPYGTLWKLDEMLNPTAPRGRRTPAQRRRQALFLFVFGVVVCSLFLVPYHITHLRRVAISMGNVNLGLSADLAQADTVVKTRRGHIEKLAALFGDAEVLSAQAASTLSQQWRHTLYFDDRLSPVPPQHLFRTEGYARAIAGLAFHNGLVPSLTGDWSPAPLAAAGGSPPAAPWWPHDKFWPPMRTQSVSHAGCLRGLVHTIPDGETAVKMLFAAAVEAAEGWQSSNLLHASENATPTPRPPAVMRVELFLEAVAATWRDRIRLISCDAVAEDVDGENGDAAPPMVSCVCACAGAGLLKDDLQLSLASKVVRAGAPYCKDTCACG